MLIAGLLTSDQLAGIFLNVDELIRANACFSSMLQEAMDRAKQKGDQMLVTVNVGKIFNEEPI